MHVFRKTPTNVGKGVFHDPGKTGRHYFYLLVDATDDFLLGERSKIQTGTGTRIILRDLMQKGSCT